MILRCSDCSPIHFTEHAIAVLRFLNLVGPSIHLRWIVDRSDRLCKAQGYKILVSQLVLWSHLSHTPLFSMEDVIEIIQILSIKELFRVYKCGHVRKLPKPAQVIALRHRLHGS